MNPSSTEAKRWLGRWWGDTRADARKLGAIVPLAAQAQFFRIGAEASLPEVATSPAEDPAPQLPKAEPTVSPPSTPTGKKTELEAGQPVSRRGRSSSPAAARVKAQPQPEDTPGAGSSTGPPRGCSAPAARRSSEPEPKTLQARKMLRRFACANTRSWIVRVWENWSAGSGVILLGDNTQLRRTRSRDVPTADCEHCSI